MCLASIINVECTDAHSTHEAAKHELKQDNKELNIILIVNVLNITSSKITSRKVLYTGF